MAPLESEGTRLGKFEILSHLATGGMAEIYLARATGIEGFEKVVVIKRMLPELARNAELVDLFLHEARLAATLDHSNVVQVYDVGIVDGNYFFAMEFVHGQDVRTILRSVTKKDGEIPLDVAISIAIGVCAGLHYAHEKRGPDGVPLRIVHRDISPSNILVSYEGSVKLVDFGIAKVAGRRQETQVGSVRGKFGYMSPEQCQSKPLDRRSDLFALAIVLWEMTTCRQLFRGDTEYAVMQQIVEQDPPRPSTMNRPSYPPELERIVMKGLAKDPDMRWSTAREMQIALEAFARDARLAVSPVTVERFMEGEFAEVIEEWRRAKREGRPLVHLVSGQFDLSTTAAAPALLAAQRASQAAIKRPRGRWKIIVAATVAVALIGAAFVGWRIALRGRGRTRTVVVLGLKNLSGKAETAWLSTAASEMLDTELGAGGELHTLPGEDVARVKSDLALSDAESYSAETLARIRGRTGADLVIVGSYFALGTSDEKVRFDLRAQATEGGETVATVSDNGTVAQLPDVVERTGGVLRRRLGVAATQSGDAVRASMPSNAEAARLYSEGLARMRLFDAATARDLLEKAVAVEPEHPLPHSALAAAWAALGYDERAVAEARLAFQHAGSLPSEEQRSVEAQYRITAKEWDEAVELYRGLWREHPDRLDYGLRLAATQREAQRSSDALATVATLRRLPAPDSTDPRIDLIEAEAYDLLSDFTRHRAAAVRAAERGRSREAWRLVAQARSQEGWAERNLGLRVEAAAAFTEARQLFERTGDSGGVSRALNRLAVLRYDEGDFEGAGKLYEEALAKAREIGAKQAQARTLNNLALLRCDQGQLGRARALFDEALALSREVRDLSNVACVSYGIGDVLARQGDGAHADHFLDESLETARAIKQQRFVVDALYVRASARFRRGRLVDARHDAEASLAAAREIGDRAGASFADCMLGEVLVAQGDLAAARPRIEESLATRVQSDYQVLAAHSRVALGQLSLEEGTAPAAVTLLRAAIGPLSARGLSDDESLAQGLLARALEAEHHTDEARAAAARAETLAAHTERPDVRLAAAIAVARMRSPVEANKALDGARKEAERYELPGLAFEARLASIEIGPSPKRAARREALVRDATKAGFLTIARRAGR